MIAIYEYIVPFVIFSIAKNIGDIRNNMISQENKFNQACYPDDEQGRRQAHIDEQQESNIKGQKEALEWIVEGM